MFCLKHRQIVMESDYCDEFLCGSCGDEDCDASCCNNCSRTVRLKWRHWASDFWSRYIMRRNGLLSPDKLRHWIIYLWLWARHDRGS